MPTRDQPVVMKDFAGLNRRDGGDKVLANQFFLLQNFFPYSKGLLYKRPGTTLDTDISSLGGFISSIKEMNRFYSPYGERMTLMYCEPDATALPAASSVPVTLSEVSGGDIFNGGSVSDVSIHTTLVGRGVESSPFFAGSITLSSNTKAVQIQVPALPPGISSINIFAGVLGMTSGNDVFIGSLGPSGGTLTFSHYIGPAASGDDEPPSVFQVGSYGSGNLKRGKYYIGVAWVSAANNWRVSREAPVTGAIGPWSVFDVQNDNTSLTLTAGANTFAPDGAKYVAFFIGSKPPTEGPMTFVGIRKSNTFPPGIPTSQSDPTCITISSLPSPGCNAQTAISASTDTDKKGVWFLSTTINSFFGGPTSRPSFLMRKNADGTIQEIAFSRTAYDQDYYLYTDPLTGGNKTLSSSYKRDKCNRKAWVVPGGSPMMTSYLGACYIANGVQLLLQTDGYTLCEVAEVSGTIQPGFPTNVLTYKDQLIATMKQYPNQLFGSNATAPRNWVSSGTGTSLRFVTVGDPFGDGVKGLGVFSFTSGTEGPKSYLMATKKASTWIINNISDLASGIPSSMDQLSGRAGCIATRTMVQTPIGFVFLGNDGDVYLSRGSGEPYRIGGAIRPILQHLTDSDTLMSMATASYHLGFYKLCYPSSPSSTSNDAELWADLRTEQGIPITWSGPHAGRSIGPQIVLAGEGDSQSRYGIKSDGSGIVLLDDQSTFQDLGQPIVSKLTTKTFRFNAEMHYKRLTSIVLDAYYDTQFAHSVLFEAFMDDQYTQYNKTLSSGSAVWDGSQFDQGLWGDAFYQAVPWFIGPAPLVGRTLIFQLTHSSNAQFILAAVGCTVQPERRQIV